MSGYSAEELNFRGAAYDENIFNAFYEEYFSRIYNYVYFHCTESAWAEELTGQIFEKILKGLPNYDSNKGSLNTWIYAVAKNHVLDFQRSGRKQSRFSLEEIQEEPKSGDPGPFETVLLLERSEHLHRLLSFLSEKEKQIIVLKFYARLQSKEIAPIAGLTEKHINVVVHRSLRKLRNMVQEQGFEL